MVEVPMITNYTPMTVSIRYVYLARWWFQLFCISTPIWGRWTPFDVHIIFQMGWLKPPTSHMSTYSMPLDSNMVKLLAFLNDPQVLQLHGRFVHLEARQGLRALPFSHKNRVDSCSIAVSVVEQCCYERQKTKQREDKTWWPGRFVLFLGGHFFQIPTVILFCHIFFRGVKHVSRNQTACRACSFSVRLGSPQEALLLRHREDWL